MTCAEFQEQAALLALGALSPEEVALAEAHLAEARHAGCLEALRRASDGIEVLARSLESARPDERVWRGIEARLDGAAPVRLPARRTAPPWRERLAWGAAAAAVVLLLANLAARSHDNQRFAEQAAKASRLEQERATATAALEKDRAGAIAVSARLEKERESCAKELLVARDEAARQQAAVTLLQTPSTLVVALAPPKGGKPGARALLNLEQRKGVLLSVGLAPQPGKDYELWIVRGDKKLPAGLLRAGPSGAVLASIDAELLSSGRPDAVAVTLEATGGAPQPTGPILLVGALPKS
jgi:hypothetical protein